ncbi:hypothetical protein [Streptomyces sp. BRB081]|uniref:hypothetical protein n=1 Tax=Streptomyces sp. BRB081 TaxID=2769544 RepID=UPI0018AC8ECC|nr:hypothetical protein [Streptomyces sp. BRB081]MBL3802982.1 hypothetical protein [Streptomyces sp. BRB081]
MLPADRHPRQQAFVAEFTKVRGKSGLLGTIKFTEPEPQKEPKNLRRLKKAIRKKWGTVALIDILKEAALRTGMLKALAPVGTREAIDEAKLLERLPLIA